MRPIMTKSIVAVVGLILTGAVFAASRLSGSRLAIAGPDSAPITIEEFVDFQCHHCASGSKTMEQVLRDYPGQVRLVLRNMPMQLPNAMNDARAFNAVLMQKPSVAYAFQHELFENQSELVRLGDAYLFTVAAKLGVDVTQMKLDMMSARVTQDIAEDEQLFKAHGFRGTPSFLVGGEEVSGAVPYADFKAIIERKLGH